jgi:hypothetical protein
MSDRRAPTIGKHLAALNLFREADGSIWMTVAESREAVALHQQNPAGPKPMGIVAEWVGEAAKRFVESWSEHGEGGE